MYRALAVSLLVLGACASADQAGADAMRAPDAGVAPDACAAVAEVCDGVDQDCDDAIDEDFPDLGAACEVGTGACVAAGVRACAADGLGTACDASSGTPDGELCNGLDDDCDIAIDEGFDLGADCDGTGDTDACLEGVRACDGAGGVTCTDATGSTTETCNGANDDCAGGSDDGFMIGTACMTGTGACLDTGTFQCTGPSTSACDAVAGNPTAETCGDGVDQDCNGSDVACPVNDLAGGAIDISAGGTFTVDLSAARDNAYTAGTYCGSTGGRDVYYQFTLPAAEVVYVDTFGSNFDTVERIHAGACATTLGALQSCADDAIDACVVTSPVRPEQAAFSLAAGTYCLVVDQYSSSTTAGSLVLKMIRGGRAGTALPASPVTSTTVGLTDVTDGSCRDSTAPDKAYYFLVCPSTTKTVAANLCTTSTYDSVLYLRDAATGTERACNDDNGPACTGTAASFSGATITGPTMGWLTVDGYLANAGAFTLTYTM